MPYYKALEAADDAHKHRSLNVRVLEKLLDDALAEQLVAVHRKATGKKPEKINRKPK